MLQTLLKRIDRQEQMHPQARKNKGTSFRKGVFATSAIAMSLSLLTTALPIMTTQAAADPTLTYVAGVSRCNGNYLTTGPDGALWWPCGSNMVRTTTSGDITLYPITSGAVDVAAGSDGALWFTGTNQIGRITTSGTVTTYPTTAPTSRITGGPDGALWFTETIANRIGKITTSGAITEYALPSGIANPYAITTGSDGALWFTAYTADQTGTLTGAAVGRMDTAGTITAYPVPNSGAEDVFDAGGITNGPDGALWFTNALVNEVGRVTTSGAFTIYPISGSGHPANITTGSDEALWFLDGISGQNEYIGRITTTGDTALYPVASTIPFQMAGITTGPDGNIWFFERVVPTQLMRLTVPPAVPTAPVGLTAASPAQYPTLSWNATLGATSYNIYRNGILAGSSSATTYTDDAAPEGNETYTVIAVNTNGGSTPSTPITVLVDRTPPTITYTFSPQPTNSGWNNSSVTVAFACTDSDGSGVASYTSPSTLSSEGANQTVTGTCTDNTGNTASVTAPINMDETAPTLGVPSWSANPIQVGSNSTLTVPASDGLSGVAGGEYYIGTDPGVGNGIPMTYGSGNLTAALGSSLSAGVYDIGIRTKDMAGNWSQVTNTMIVVTDQNSTLGMTGKNKKNLIPSLANGDSMPGLTSANQTDAADYGFTVQYKNGNLDSKNAFHFDYATGANCNKPSATNCHSFALIATNFVWLVVNGTNNSQGEFEGTATVTVDGVTTSNPFIVTGIDGSLLTPSTNDSLVLKVYASGADPSSATPIYQASGSMTSHNSVVIK